MSLANVFFRNNHSYVRNVERKSVIPMQGAKIEAEKTWRTTTSRFAGTSDGCKIGTKFEKCVYSNGQTGSRKKGGPTIIIVKKQ